MGQRVHLSTICLVTIGILDLVTSLMWLHMGHGEGNPLFARLARGGSVPFAFGKVVLLAGPVLALEYARKTHPKSAEQGTWLAAVLYVALLGAHVYSMLNRV